MLSKEDNELLCRIEGDAPMGRMMRRYWIPACMSEEAAEPDGDPVRVRLFGEDLVVFRDTEGRLGVIEEYCPHRGASLFYGRNEASGLRCLYHGWKMDVEGNVVDMSSEPQGSRLSEKIRHVSYPVREAAGLVWVYMGEPEHMPGFEPPPFASGPDPKVSIVKIRIDCNWAQVLEGAIDSAHSSSLHSSDIRPAKVERAGMTTAYMTRPSTDKSPRLYAQNTGYGMRYAAIRRPIHNSATHDYVRITAFIAPCTVLIPPNSQYSLAQLSTPIDDTATMFYFIAWSDAIHGGGGIDQEAWRKFCGAQVGIDLDHNFNNLRNRRNDYLQDRKGMRINDFTGIRGIPNQDIAMWETMGPIARRHKDRLGASDVAIVQFRQRMVDAVKAFRDGAPPPGQAEPRVPYASIRSFEGVVPKTIEWTMLAGAGAQQPEAASRQA
jgi:phthalate 4,5-dioxygenase oxygenase subunit